MITWRAADPALYLAPLAHAFGRARDDWLRLDRGTLIGHLLECAGQVSGGHFADPGYKDVPDLARLGFSYCEGNAVIGKPQGSGGMITEVTCKEQLLYEIHDPARYPQPDVVADFSNVVFRQMAPDLVAVSGGSGHPRTGLLKVSVGYQDCYVGEGQISYAGPGAVRRGRLAQEIVRERLKAIGVECLELRCELIGTNAILGACPLPSEPAEVRLRVAARARARWDATRVGNEVEALYLNGPTGGGGVTKSVRPMLSIASTLTPETLVETAVQIVEA